MFSQIYSDDALSHKAAELTVTQLETLEKEAIKKERKQEAKDEQMIQKRMASKVTIKRIERNKRKHVTSVYGLDAFGIDLKKAAKLFATRFAASSSVTKNMQGFDEIVIGGDVADEVEEMLLEKTGKAAEILGKGIVPGDNIEIIDEKKKKVPEAA